MERKKILFIVNPISGTHSKENVPDWVQNTLDKNIFVPEIVLPDMEVMLPSLPAKP